MSLSSPVRLAVLAAAVACLSPRAAFAEQGAAPPPGMTRLALINGWKAYEQGAAPALTAYKGVVYLRGSIKETRGSNSEPFVIPAAFRPAAPVAIKLDMCDATDGRLIIDPDGSTALQSEDNFSEAQCFTSLDGASYSLTADGYKKLKLLQGWQTYGEGSAAPAAHAVGNIVHLEGAMAGGSGTAPFVLPSPLRPAAAVWLPLDMSDATNGRIGIFTDGTVFLQAQSNFSEAQSFTSLDGVSFALDSTGFTPLTLANGWAADTVDGTATPSVRLDHGIVTFHGAITLPSGSNNVAFTLPSTMWPSHDTYIPVDTNQCTNGRLIIYTNGAVAVQGEEGNNTNAFAFTSLDGVSFHL
jgi:hypothetical protein